MSDQKIKYPKPRTERPEGQNSETPSENEKYHKIVEAHSPEVIAVTKREKRIEDLLMPGKTTIEKQLEKQALLARIIKAVKKW